MNISSKLFIFALATSLFSLNGMKTCGNPLDKAWQRLALDHQKTGQLNPSTRDEFNNLRISGMKFQQSYGITPHVQTVLHALGLTPQEWLKLQK